MIHIFKATVYVHVIVMLISACLQYFHIESLFKNIHLPETAVILQRYYSFPYWWSTPTGCPFIALYHTSQVCFSDSRYVNRAVLFACKHLNFIPQLRQLISSAGTLDGVVVLKATRTHGGNKLLDLICLNTMCPVGGKLVNRRMQHKIIYLSFI